jgi:transposase
MQKTQRTYTKEFKLEAVQLVQTSEKSMAQIARDLGIADSTLHHWCKLLTEQGEQAFPGSGHQTPQEEEMRHLKRENELLRQERDILKRAMPLRGITAHEHWYTGRERSQRQDGVYA